MKTHICRIILEWSLKRAEESATSGTLGQAVAMATTRVEHGVTLWILSRYEMKRDLWETPKGDAAIEGAVSRLRTQRGRRTYAFYQRIKQKMWGYTLHALCTRTNIIRYTYLHVEKSKVSCCTTAVLLQYSIQCTFQNVYNVTDYTMQMNLEY